MKKVMIGLLLCSLVITILSGCRVNISIGTNDTLTSETYPDAEKYQIGSFTYNAAGIKAVEVYWRSGEVEITESDNSELHIKESGGELPEDTAMHYLLDDGVLRIRFCKSGAKIQVNAADIVNFVSLQRTKLRGTKKSHMSPRCLKTAPLKLLPKQCGCSEKWGY